VRALPTAVISLIIATASAACGDDGSLRGVRGECASFGGAGLECESPSIETAADACWRLVDCGVIPLANPEGNEECCFDWSRCMSEIEGLDDYNRDLILACVETSSCDELKTDRSPEGPGRNDEALPLCLQHGNP
jgi:hypothetical protein